MSDAVYIRRTAGIKVQPQAGDGQRTDQLALGQIKY